MRLEPRVAKLEAVNGGGDRKGIILLIDPTPEEFQAVEATADEKQLCIVRFVVPANGERHSETLKRRICNDNSNIGKE